MLRISCRLLAPFDTILCGTVDQLSTRAGNAELIEKMTTEYRKRTTEAALPLPLATIKAASYVQEKNNHDSLLTIFATHPQKERLIQSVSSVLSSDSGNYETMTPLDWISFLNLLKKVDASVDTIVFAIQCAATSYDKKSSLRKSTAVDDLEECERQQEALRGWTVRFVRYHPTSAPSLLRPLCLLSRCKDPELLAIAKDDIAEVVQHALKEGFVHPEDCGLVLQLMYQPGRVLSMWRWMQHTSAKWDRVASSEAVIALSRSRRFPEAVNVLQTLASVQLTPTVPAQVAFLDLLAHVTPALPDYGDQLVEYWHPEESGRWKEDVVDVVAAQLFLHFRCGNYDQCLSLMTSAADHLSISGIETMDSKRQTAFARFMSARGLFQVIRYFFTDVAEHDILRRVFFDQSLEMIEMLASRSTAISIVIGIGRRIQGTAGIPKIYEAMHKLAPIIDDIAFEKVMRAIAEDYTFNSSHETLELMENISSILKKPIPSELVGWLKLL